MTIKQKIIDALSRSPESLLNLLSEDQLVDVLLQQHAKQAECLQREGQEHQRAMHEEHERYEALHQEVREMRTNPLVHLEELYFFVCNGRYFTLQVRGSFINFAERKGGVDYCARQISSSQFAKATPWNPGDPRS